MVRSALPVTPFLLALLLLLTAPPANGQSEAYDVIYRPRGSDYLVLKSPHFDVIFEAGYAGAAQEMAYILEADLDLATRRIGVKRTFRMPVVLNGFNDRANGYVTAVPFKQEVELTSIKSIALSPRHPSWLETVGPHELAHAVHASYGQGFGVVGGLRWFVPDIARALNLAVPAGFTEGIAVYHESHRTPGVGRLSHAPFTMQFRAAMGQKRPWSLSQMLEPSAYTLPFDRHYIGGAHLVAALVEREGEGVIPDLLAFNYRYFFPGFGLALWGATGRRPYLLGRALRLRMKDAETQRLAELGPVTSAQLVRGRRGESYRRPRWLDGETLVAYASGYALRPGLYRIHVATGERSLIAHEQLTEDLYYSLSPDRKSLYFSRYVPDRTVKVQDIAEAFRLDLTTGKRERLTRDGRVHAPVESAGGQQWALVNDGPSNQWAVLMADEVKRVLDTDHVRFSSLVPGPDMKRVLVIANQEGQQALHLATMDGGRDGDDISIAPLLGFSSASIYDAAWHHGGEIVVFSADLDGVMNLYAYHLSRRELRKITHVPYGAFEPALSPDGQTLAFSSYAHERYDLVTVPFRYEEGTLVDRDVLASVQPLADRRADAPMEVRAEPTAEITPYVPAPYLRPRLVYPVVKGFDDTDGAFDPMLGPGFGVAIEGTDPLQAWVYTLEGFIQDGQPWGTFTFTTGATVLRPLVRVFRTPEPVQLAILFRTEDGPPETVIHSFGREQRGVGLQVGVPVTLASNVYQTSMAFAVEGRYEEERYFGGAEDILAQTGLDDFEGRLTLTPALALGLRLQSNRRDLIPNTGAIVRVNGLNDLTEGENFGRRRSILASLDVFLPWLSRYNIGINLKGSLLWQNRGGIYNLDAFSPRGWQHNERLSNTLARDGTFWTYGLDTVLPLRFVDNGMVLVPLYVKALYGYGFAERLLPRHDPGVTFTSLGAGVGIQWRFFATLDFDLKFGLAWQVEEGQWTAVLR